MEKMRVLLANEPRVYREVISAALRKLRPLVEVGVCGPEDLEHEASRFRPHLVICSEAEAAARAECLVWILLYPDGEDRMEIGGAGLGEAASLPSGVNVSDLLALLDETELSLDPRQETEETADG